MTASAVARGSSRRRGFTVVELLVAMFVLVTVLAIASVFFARQVQLQRAVQARNDVQDRVRVAAQLVTQDLSLAGAPLRIGADGRIDTAAGVADCAQVAGETLCVDLSRNSSMRSTLRVRYLSSQFATAEACRDVAYRLDGTTLQRSDVACDAADAFIDLAPDLLGFKLVVVCSTGARVEGFAVGSCGSDAYGRSAIVSVGAQSSIPATGTSPTISFVTDDADNPATVACPDGRVCFGMTQEVLMPNLKDR